MVRIVDKTTDELAKVRV